MGCDWWLFSPGTLNFSCAKAPAPAPNPNGSNFSVFDRNIPFFANSYHPIDLLLICSCFVLVACYWTDCGGGSCNNTSVFTHSCVCEEGYYNLFNSTSFPCYKECKHEQKLQFLAFKAVESILMCEYLVLLGAIGGDCGNLGISVMNASNLSPPRSSGVVDDSKSHGEMRLHHPSLVQIPNTAVVTASDSYIDHFWFCFSNNLDP